MTLRARLRPAHCMLMIGHPPKPDGTIFGPARSLVDQRFSALTIREEEGHGRAKGIDHPPLIFAKKHHFNIEVLSIPPDQRIHDATSLMILLPDPRHFTDMTAKAVHAPLGMTGPTLHGIGVTVSVFVHSHGITDGNPLGIGTVAK